MNNQKFEYPVLLSSLCCLIILVVGGCRSFQTLQMPNEQDADQIRKIQMQLPLLRREQAVSHFDDGLSSFGRGELKMAYYHWSKSTRLLPEWDLPYLQLALLHPLFDNNQDAELKALKRAVTYNPFNPRTQFYLGVALQSQGHQQQAELHFVEAIRQKKGYKEAHLRLGNLYRSQKRIDDALSEFEVLSTLSSESGFVHSVLADLYESKGRYREAEVALRRVIAKQKDTSYGFYKLGQFFERTKQKSKAAEAFLRAERYKPRSEKRNLRPLLPSRR